MAFVRKKTSERWEALMRIPVAIVSGIIIGLWRMLAQFVALINWFVTIITGRRNADLASFANNYISEYYRFIRYMYFATNERPFPFTSRRKPIERVKK